VPLRPKTFRSAHLRDVDAVTARFSLPQHAADDLESFELRVASLQATATRRFCSRSRAPTSPAGTVAGEDAHDIGASLDFGIDAFELIGSRNPPTITALGRIDAPTRTRSSKAR
jgi:hypothetical protein